MSGAPYYFARSCTLADEQYFRATELATRLLALTGGRRPILKRVQLHRPHGPSGPAVMISCGRRPFGYVLRPGSDGDDLSEKLNAAFDAALARPAERVGVAA